MPWTDLGLLALILQSVDGITPEINVYVSPYMGVSDFTDKFYTINSEL